MLLYKCWVLAAWYSLNGRTPNFFRAPIFMFINIVYSKVKKALGKEPLTQFLREAQITLLVSGFMHHVSK